MATYIFDKLIKSILKQAREGDIRAPYNATNFNNAASPSSPENVVLRDSEGNGYHPFILSVDSLTDESARLI